MLESPSDWYDEEFPATDDAGLEHAVASVGLPARPGAGTAEVARATYLADTSAFTRLNKPHVAAAIGPLIAEGKVALCAPVAFELGFSARSGADHDAIMSRIDAFGSAPTTEPTTNESSIYYGSSPNEVTIEPSLLWTLSSQR